MLDTETEVFDLKILALDPAMAYTGCCVYSVSTSGFKFRINYLGIIQTDSGEANSRVRSVVDTVKELIELYEVNYVILEEPPTTIYKSRFLTRDQLVGRAASVFTTFSTCYSIIGLCCALNIYWRTVLPATWQQFKISEVKNTKTEKVAIAKNLSLDKARKILKYLNHPKKLKPTEHHVADAINIGFFVISNLSSKKWELPPSLKVDTVL